VNDDIAHSKRSIFDDLVDTGETDAKSTWSGIKDFASNVFRDPGATIGDAIKNIDPQVAAASFLFTGEGHGSVIIPRTNLLPKDFFKGMNASTATPSSTPSDNNAIANAVKDGMKGIQINGSSVNQNGNAVNPNFTTPITNSTLMQGISPTAANTIIQGANGMNGANGSNGSNTERTFASAGASSFANNTVFNHAQNQTRELGNVNQGLDA